MGRLVQKSVPGIVGISTDVDCIYHKELQSAALAASGDKGPINRLRTVSHVAALSQSAKKRGGAVRRALRPSRKGLAPHWQR
jgi:hypothetical protein